MGGTHTFSNERLPAQRTIQKSVSRFSLSLSTKKSCQGRKMSLQEKAYRYSSPKNKDRDTPRNLAQTLALISFAREKFLDKSREKKQVRFSAEAKKYDGIRVHDQILDDLVWKCVRSELSDLRSVALVFTNRKAKNRHLQEVLDLLINLVCRVQEGKGKAIPVLPHGGGRSLNVSAYYLQRLVNLTVMVKSLNEQFTAFMATNNKKRASPSCSRNSLENEDDVEKEEEEQDHHNSTLSDHDNNSTKPRHSKRARTDERAFNRRRMLTVET